MCLSQAVWDYAADRYVHRLVQNKADGKLVELSTPQSHVPFKGTFGRYSGGLSCRLTSYLQTTPNSTISYQNITCC